MVNCKLETLSPIHIGNGNEYSPMEYAITSKNGRKFIRRINLDDYYNNLNSNDKLIFSKQLNIILLNYKNNKKDLNIKNRFNGIFKEINKNKSKEDKLILKDFSRYSISIDNVNSNDINNITETIKTLDKPYIPGSSIKGSIKNAILFNEFNINNLKNKKEVDENLKKIFSSDIKQYSQKNILRFIKVSDTDTIKHISLYKGISKNLKPKNSTEDIKLFYETINKGKTFNFEIKNDTNDDLLYHLNLKEKKDLISIDYIKESLYNFNKTIISEELEYCEKYNKSENTDTLNTLIKFYENLDKKCEKNTLLCLGHNTGYLNKTLFLKLKELNYNNLLNKIINHNKRKTDKKYKNLKDFPESRTITFTRKKSYIPFGWAKITFDE